jgi:ubiquinone/menaquinone biosynthesis C-methylase UbiE
MSHEKIAETFDSWAEDGRHAGMEDGHGDVVRQVVARMGVRPGDTILDLGCGNGWATRLLGQAAAGATALGVDVAPAMIAQAEALHENTVRARYEVGRFEALDFANDKFKRAFSMEAFYYAVDLHKALSEVLRVLKPGGTFDCVVNYFEESAASSGWPEYTGLAMNRLDTAGWVAAFERAGFADVTTERVIDTRGPSKDDDEQRALHEAGSLWVRGHKPS